MVVKGLLIILSVAFCTASFAQTATIKGMVFDASTREPLPFSNVFVNNTSLGTSADNDGNFAIHNVPFPGTYELIVSFVGFESYSLKVNVTGEELSLRSIFLKPLEVVLSDVEVKSTRDKSWEKKLKKFTRTFLGTDKQADLCTILNPWVVDFPEGKNAEFIAEARTPIEIENKALGYKVRFFLSEFVSTPMTYRISGKSFFEDLVPANNEERDRWMTARDRAYRNSKQYLFKSIVDRQIAGNGFRFFKEIAKGRSHLFYTDFGKTVMPYDTLTLLEPSAQNGTYGIRLNGVVEVHYTGDVLKSGVYRDVPHPVSWIEAKNGLVVVNKDGFEMNASETITDGAINNVRIPQLVPYNYRPQQRGVVPVTQPKDDISFLEEKLYVHTDKPYYCPGETIWFKGYIRYRTPSLQDSLSQTVYADLINSNKQVMDSKMLEIVNGSFHSQFDLPDSTHEGNYYLRCYTNLNRNFGDDDLYVKYLPVLEATQTIDEQGDATEDNELITIISSKDVYHRREKIDLTFKPGSGEDEVFSGTGLSVSVTDMKQVTPVSLNPSIVDRLELGNDIGTVKAVYPVEYGFGFKGKFTEVNTTSKESLLGVVQLKPSGYLMAAMDRNGNFSVNGLHFYDSAYFTFVPVDRKNSKGTATILPRADPPITIPEHRVPVVKKTGKLQRSPQYKTDQVTILEEVTIKAPRVWNETIGTLNGAAGQVVSGDVLRKSGAPNLLLSLQGKFPALEIRSHARAGNVFWTVALSGQRDNWAEVRVAVDGNFVWGPAWQALLGIDIEEVESVELIRGRSNYGEFQANGILSVHTRLVPNDYSGGKKILVKGYDRPRRFTAPDPNREDLRSTIYWDPAIMLNATGEAHVTFYAADAPGKYKIVLEGTTRGGVPIHSEKVIEIE